MAYFKPNSNKGFSQPGPQSPGILDDHAVRKSEQTRELEVLDINKSKRAIRFHGQIQMPNGTAAAPSIAFNNSTNTGFYNDATVNVIRIATNGAYRGEISGSGISFNQVYSTGSVALSLMGRCTNSATAIGVILNNSVPLTTAGAKITSFRNAGVEKAYIDKDGKISCGGIASSGDINASSNTVEGYYGIFSGGSIRIRRVTSAVADPPTDANLDSAFGQPADLGNGFVALLTQANSSNNYICWTDATYWYYTKGTQAL